MTKYGNLVTLELVDGKCRTVITELETKTITLEEMYEKVDCSCVDIKDACGKVKKMLGIDICLIFDDEFLLTNAPVINKTASVLYGYQSEHGEYLCGNVIIAKNEYNKDGELMTGGLSDEEAFKVVSLIFAIQKILPQVKFV